MNKGELLCRTLPTAEVRGILVRGLSRAEAKKLPSFEGDADLVESFVLSAALLEPRLTPEEVATYLEVATHDEVDEVLNCIMELSGLTTRSRKSE